MADTHAFAVDVFRIICDRLTARAADLRALAGAGASFEDWLAWEAFLACDSRRSTQPFCEVAARPAYASEGGPDDGDPEHRCGDLRVGATEEADDHRWLFAEVALLHPGNRAGGQWRQKLDDDTGKLLRLGWRRSASLLIVIVANPGDSSADWTADLAALPVWNQPALTDSFTLALPGGGSVVARAFDIKRDPGHRLGG